MPPHVATPRPGPCPGSKRGAPKAPRAITAPKKAVKQLTPLTEKIAKPTAVGSPPPSVAKRSRSRKTETAAPVKQGQVKNLFAPKGQKNPTRVPPETLASLKQAYEVEHAGLSTRIRSAGSDEGHVYIDGDIFGPDGKKVGAFRRIIEREKSGDTSVKHDILIIDPEFQGQGLARELNNKSLDWYRSQGFSRVRLSANVDIGAYAWARAGYDWDTPADARKLVKRLEEMAGGEDKSAARLAEGMLERFADSKFGTSAYPTPFELSELGRPANAGRDSIYPGKTLFRSAKSHKDPNFLVWEAELPLKEKQLTAAAAADRATMVAKLAEVHDRWVGKNLGGTKFVARKSSPDFNLYYVDVDAPGAAQDDLAAAMGAVIGRAGGRK